MKQRKPIDMTASQISEAWTKPVLPVKKIQHLEEHINMQFDQFLKEMTTARLSLDSIVENLYLLGLNSTADELKDHLEFLEHREDIFYDDIATRHFSSGIWMEFHDTDKQKLKWKGSYNKTGQKTGWWESYYEDGQLDEKGNFKDGKQEGPWIGYYDNGQLESKVNLKDGKIEGPWIGYWKNGQLWFKGNYKDGKREGPSISYWDNGQLKSQGNYKDGKKEGPWVGYWDNGELWDTGNFKDGKKEGPWFSYSKDGTVNSEFTCFYKDGSMAQL